MATKTISVEMLAKMFLAGAQNIESKKEFINELNVFPVPDGDTGNQYVADDHVCGKRSDRIERLYNERSCQSDLFRVSAGSQGELRCDLVSAPSGIYQVHTRRKRD